MARRKSKKNSKVATKPGLSDTFGGITEIAAGTAEDEVAAINDYIERTPARTIIAEEKKERWRDWYRSLGWYEYYVETEETVNIARSRRYEFNESNLTPEPQKPKEVYIDAGGYIADQHSVTAQRQAVVEEVSEPLVPPKVKMALYIGGGLVVAHFVLRKAIDLARDAKEIVNPLAGLRL